MEYLVAIGITVIIVAVSMLMMRDQAGRGRKTAGRSRTIEVPVNESALRAARRTRRGALQFGRR